MARPAAVRRDRVGGTPAPPPWSLPHWPHQLSCGHLISDLSHHVVIYGSSGLQAENSFCMSINGHPTTCNLDQGHQHRGLFSWPISPQIWCSEATGAVLTFLAHPDVTGQGRVQSPLGPDIDKGNVILMLYSFLIKREALLCGFPINMYNIHELKHLVSAYCVPDML